MTQAIAPGQVFPSSQPPPRRVSSDHADDASVHIPPKDASELRWFFRTGGTGVFSMTPFEAQLERMRLFARPQKCRRCRGEGFSPLNPKRWIKTTEAERDLQAWLGKKRIYLVSPRSRGVNLTDWGVCRRCGGVGWVEATHRPRKHKPVTVRTRCVRGSDRWGSVPLSSGGVSVSDVDVVRLARIERRLLAIRAEEPVLYRALAAYHEPTGGGLRGLWELVPAGQTLLRRNGLRELPTLLFFHNAVAEQAERPDPQVGSLLAACDEQAKRLLEEASRAWNAAAAVRSWDGVQ